MKKLLGILAITLLIGCSSANVGDDILKNKELSITVVANTEEGFLYRENGKFYYVEEIGSDPKEIDINDVAEYMYKATVK